ncbi:transposable element Tcb1 transposase [Trichonephila clavipes]|nr:transposable element Tcb1 transposase [Trichonephila clavipes]
MTDQKIECISPLAKGIIGTFDVILKQLCQVAYLSSLNDYEVLRLPNLVKPAHVFFLKINEESTDQDLCNFLNSLERMPIDDFVFKNDTNVNGNRQIEQIVRHNGESVREGYIRNGGKEVKLFTNALKAFQCNNHIVMAQRKHLDDFLRGRIIGRPECGRIQLEVSEELGITQSVISWFWQRFQDGGNVNRCYRTGFPRVTTPNEDRYLEVTAKRNRRSTASDMVKNCHFGKNE